MQPRKYNSPADSKFLSLFEKTWQECSQFLHPYQWALDEPTKSPRSSEIASAIKNKGKPGSHTFQRDDGFRYILRSIQPWVFQSAVERERKIYYVSSGKQALLYFDIDLHQTWQTIEHGQEAKRLIDKLFPQLFWAESSRGFNGYLKVDLLGTDYQKANAIFDRLQKAIQLYLARFKNLADFEIKGRVGYMQAGQYQWAQYGKLPIHRDWNFKRLEEFSKTPSIALYPLLILCKQIENAIPESVLERQKEYKKSLGEEPIKDGNFFLVTPAIEKALIKAYGEHWYGEFSQVARDRDGKKWLGLSYYRPGQLPLTEMEWQEAHKTARKPVEQPKPEQVVHPKTPKKINLIFSDALSEPDSFKRQRDVLLRYARCLKRVPGLEEGLRIIRDQRSFTGEWEENKKKRKTRVRDTLKFIGRTFDPAKCSKGSVNLGKYDKWVRQRFPEGLVGRPIRLSESGDKMVEGPSIPVSAAFIGVFLAIAEFCLITDKNGDNSLPHDRAEALWQALYAKGVISVRFNGRKWAACRDALDRLEIVLVTDRDYHTGKAMRWAIGRFFPHLDWWRTKKQPSMQGPGCYSKNNKKRREQHNTWLHKETTEPAFSAPLRPPRPPPGVNRGERRAFWRQNEFKKWQTTEMVRIEA